MRGAASARRLLIASLFLGSVLVPSVAEGHGGCTTTALRPWQTGGNAQGGGSVTCQSVHPHTWIKVTLQRSLNGTNGWTTLSSTLKQYLASNTNFVGGNTGLYPYACQYYYRTTATGWQWNSGSGDHNTNTDLSPNLQKTC